MNRTKAVLRDIDLLHPILREIHKKILSDVINQHNLPFRLFETGRTIDRHKKLVDKGRSRSLVSNHFFNLSCEPKLYSRAMDYVYYDGKWSWNFRDARIKRFWQLFGELAIDSAIELYNTPILRWGGYDRKNTQYDHFELNTSIIKDLSC